MRPRTGFALVRITALRRRQDPSANFFFFARLDGVPPIAGCAAPARLPNYSETNSPQRPTCVGGFAVLSVRLVSSRDSYAMRGL